MTYRPTTLELERKHCPAAISHYEHGTPAHRDHFHVGTAAHAILERLGNYARDIGHNPAEDRAVDLADAVAVRLGAEGRVFDGERDPPMPLDDVAEGRRIALDWHATHGMSHTAQYEIGIGFSETPRTGHWSPTLYDPKRNRWRLIADVIDVDDGLVVVRDYKSAWPTSEAGLRNLQQRAQALAVIDTAHARRDDVWGVEIQLANLRTRQIHSRTLDLEGDREELDEWRRDLSVALDTLDAQEQTEGFRTARPGLGCIACPYRARCPAGVAFMGNAPAPDIIRRALVVRDYAATLTVQAKHAAADGAIDVDGRSIGWVPDPVRVVKPSAARAIAELWDPSCVEPVAGLLAAADIGVAQLERLAAVVAGADAEDLVNAHTRVAVGARFGLGKQNDPRAPAAKAYREKKRKPAQRKQTRAEASAEAWGHKKRNDTDGEPK